MQYGRQLPGGRSQNAKDLTSHTCPETGQPSGSTIAATICLVPGPLSFESGHSVNVHCPEDKVDDGQGGTAATLRHRPVPSDRCLTCRCPGRLPSKRWTSLTKEYRHASYLQDAPSSPPEAGLQVGLGFLSGQSSHCGLRCPLKHAVPASSPCLSLPGLSSLPWLPSFTVLHVAFTLRPLLHRRPEPNRAPRDRHLCGCFARCLVITWLCIWFSNQSMGVLRQKPYHVHVSTAELIVKSLLWESCFCVSQWEIKELKVQVFIDLKPKTCMR